MKLKKFMAATLAAMTVLGSTITANAGQWVPSGNLWFYAQDDGTWAKNKWVGNYYLGPQGYMLTNCWVGQYFVGADGKWIPNASNANMKSGLNCIGTYQWLYTTYGDGTVQQANFIDYRLFSVNSDRTLTMIERNNMGGNATAQLAYLETGLYESSLTGDRYTFNGAGDLVIYKNNAQMVYKKIG